MSGQSSHFSSNRAGGPGNNNNSMLNKSMSKPTGVVTGRSAGGIGSLFGVYGQQNIPLESQRQSSGSALGISAPKYQSRLSGLDEGRKRMSMEPSSHAINALNSSL